MPRQNVPPPPPPQGGPGVPPVPTPAMPGGVPPPPGSVPAQRKQAAWHRRWNSLSPVAQSGLVAVLAVVAIAVVILIVVSVGSSKQSGDGGRSSLAQDFCTRFESTDLSDDAALRSLLPLARNAGLGLGPDLTLYLRSRRTNSHHLQGANALQDLMTTCDNVLG